MRSSVISGAHLITFHNKIALAILYRAVVVKRELILVIFVWFDLRFGGQHKPTTPFRISYWLHVFCWCYSPRRCFRPAMRFRPKSGCSFQACITVLGFITQHVGRSHAVVEDGRAFEFNGVKIILAPGWAQTHGCAARTQAIAPQFGRAVPL